MKKSPTEAGAMAHTVERPLVLTLLSEINYLAVCSLLVAAMIKLVSLSIPLTAFKTPLGSLVSACYLI